MATSRACATSTITTSSSESPCKHSLTFHANVVAVLRHSPTSWAFTPAGRSLLRAAEEGGVYCSPPEKWGVRA